jgi:nitrate/nitrite transport system substrate-binding protein
MSSPSDSTACDLYDADRPLNMRCACGRNHGRGADIEVSPDDKLEASLMKALFPNDSVRRNFLRAVGANTARAAIASVMPLGALQAMAEDKSGALEKTDLKVGFIPITCATPIIMADPLGFYKKQGLNVEVVKTAGWAVIRDKTINKEYDAAHMLAPMPIAISLGLGSQPIPYTVPAIENINGQGITLAMKHKDKRDPKDWKGFKLAIPFDYSMHNYLLRYYLAEHGIDPDTDVQLRSVPPPEMVANLRADNIDGFLAPDNICQRAIYDGVGFMHILSKEIWDGHPCCSFAASQGVHHDVAELLRRADARHRRRHRLCVEGGEPQVDRGGHRASAYLNAPPVVLEQVLTGTYADGLGGIKTDAKRVDFDPFPWQSFAVWMMTQMQRWGQIKGDVDYKGVAEQIYLATDTAKVMKEMG